MDIKYQSIVEANKGIQYTDVRGKNYAEVAQRVQAFRKVIPGGFITSDIIRIESGVVYMKAEAGYFENGQKIVMATGHAFERQDASNINKTSFIENCETSAVGRALGFMGFGSEKTIASAEEVDNAIKTQEAIEQGALSDPVKTTAPAKKANATVEKQNQLPTGNPVRDYLAKELEALRVVREVSAPENIVIWKAQIKALADAGMIPKKPVSEFTMDEAKHMVECMYANFEPKGMVLKSEGPSA